MARATLQAFLALASLGLLALVFYQDRESLLAYSWRVDLPWLGAAFVLYTVDLGLAVVGWHLIARHLGASAGLWKDARFFSLANPARRLPGRIWGFASRLYLYRAEGLPTLPVSLALGLETALIALGGALALLPLSLAVAPLNSLANPWVVGGISAGLLVLLFFPPALGPLSSLLARLPALGKVPRRPPAPALLLWLVNYLLLWLVGGLVLYAFARSLHPFPLEALPSLVGVWVLSGLVGLLSMVVPVAFGLTEASMAYLLSFQVPGPMAVAIALGLRLFLTVSEVLWMLVTTTISRRQKRPQVLNPS